jgi:hypothetical protein
MSDRRYDKLKSLIALTFPDIHWEVWGVDNKHPPLIVGGGVDGWKYGKGMLNATEGSHEAVIAQLFDQVLDWYAEDHPIEAATMRLFGVRTMEPLI